MISTITSNTRVKYDWKLDNQGNIKDLDTKIIIEGIERNTFNYKKLSSQTNVKTKNMQTGQVTTTTRTGFAPVTIITNQDNLVNISY